MFLFVGASPSDYYETVAKIECTTNGVDSAEKTVSVGDNNSEKQSEENHETKHDSSENGAVNDEVRNDEKTVASTSVASGICESNAASPLSIRQSNRNREEMEEASLVSFRKLICETFLSLTFSQLGRIIVIEKDESAVNKKDKYAKQAAADQLQQQQEQQQQQQQQCDNNNESKPEETCTTCDNTNLELSPSTSDQEAMKSEEAEAIESPSSREQQHSQSQPQSPVQDNSAPEIMSSVLATMWMGDDCGNIFVHSSVDNWAQCLHTVKLKDAVIAIV